MVSADMIRQQQQHGRQQQGGWAGETNVGEVERLASTVGGGALALYGLSRGGLGGMTLALVGGLVAYRVVTGYCSLYDALGIDTSVCDRCSGPADSVPAQAGFRVEEAVTINRPAEELYRFWRHFENLPRFMAHLESVRTTGPTTSHWVARAPLGGTVEWDAEIHNEDENRLIAWRSLEGSQVDTAGSVHFEPAPGGRGTEVRVNLKYNPPAGKLGGLIARFFGEAPEQQVRDDLRRFKQLMEAGEVATVRGQTSARA